MQSSFWLHLLLPYVRNSIRLLVLSSVIVTLLAMGCGSLGGQSTNLPAKSAASRELVPLEVQVIDLAMRQPVKREFEIEIRSDSTVVRIIRTDEGGRARTQLPRAHYELRVARKVGWWEPSGKSTIALDTAVTVGVYVQITL